MDDTNRKSKPDTGAAFTLEQAFTCMCNPSHDTSDPQKTLRSVAFLLRWFSDAGNEAVNGQLAVWNLHGAGRVCDRRGVSVHTRKSSGSEAIRSKFSIAGNKSALGSSIGP
jgi:hypothetical protein